MRIIRSGTAITTLSQRSKTSWRRSVRARLSVKTTPPSSEAAASSMAPVTETPAFIETSAFIFRMSMVGISALRASNVANITALAAALLLFSPRETGIWEPVRTMAFLLIENRSITAWTHSSASLTGSSGKPSRRTSTPSPETSSTSAQVRRSMPTAQPFPAAMALTMLTAPCASPLPFKAAPPGRPFP